VTARSVLAALAASLACLAGCSSGPAQVRAAAPACHPASPLTQSQSGFPQVQGTGAGVSLWGLLLYASRGPALANEEVKIVWRMTGSGPLELTTIGPQGQRIRLEWGPVYHGPGSSNTWDKPGEEWGAGYVFTAPGCWDLRAERDGARADVWLTVTAR